ncbi:hypothetical protein [Thalassorhabdomicrobium marinisediminis]|uniref:hypothetical protein n=1 Tax=Thalassorhabdomicrobium marinisediminis TaxID=2170577 RepID=UPI00249003D8|nr:hypothetical protein [Thalassorhabdomicrobium marinisediminis]
MFGNELYRESVEAPLQRAFDGVPETDERFAALLEKIARADRGGSRQEAGVQRDARE